MIVPFRPALAILVVTVALAASAAADGLRLDEHGGPVRGLAFAPDGGHLLSASFDYSVLLWDARAGTVETTLLGHEAAVNAVAWLPNGRAASVGDDGALVLWRPEDGSALARVDAHKGRAVALAVAPDGARIVTGGWDGTVAVWDAAGAPQEAIPAGANVNAVAFGQDGALFAAGHDGVVRIWRSADGVQLGTLEGHGFPVNALAVAPDGRTLASASTDETVRLWDLATGETRATLYGHEGPVLALAFAPDGQTLASGGADGRTVLWQTADGARIGAAAGHAGPVFALAFAPDGRTLASGGADGTIVLLAADELATASDTWPPRTRGRPAGSAAMADVPADLADGAELFATCGACHDFDPGPSRKAGPTLHGLFGREAGGADGYPYSRALRESGIVWTEATIGALFAQGPDAYTPGSKMPLQIMPDAADRAALIAFLRWAADPARAAPEGASR